MIRMGLAEGARLQSWALAIKHQACFGTGPQGTSCMCVLLGKGQRPIAHPLIDRRTAKWRKLRAICPYVQGTLKAPLPGVTTGVP